MFTDPSVFVSSTIHFGELFLGHFREIDFLLALQHKTARHKGRDNAKICPWIISTKSRQRLCAMFLEVVFDSIKKNLGESVAATFFATPTAIARYKTAVTIAFGGLGYPC